MWRERRDLELYLNVPERNLISCQLKMVKLIKIFLSIHPQNPVDLFENIVRYRQKFSRISGILNLEILRPHMF